MSEPDKDFASRFIAVARGQILHYDQHRRELEQLIDRELTKRDRWTNVFIALYGLATVGVLLFLAVRAESLPWYPVIPALFYLFFAAMVIGGVAVHVAVVIRGRYGESDRAAKANWAMWCTAALVCTLFMWWFIYPGIEDKTYFAVVAVGVLLLGVAESLRWQVRLLQRNIQETLLKTEIRLAKLIEQPANEESDSGFGPVDVRDR